MSKFALISLVLCAVMSVAPAHAQWAVIDVAAVARLTAEAQTLAQELTTTEQQLTNARQQLGALTGGRGMALLLANVERNYLPTDWAQLSAALHGGNSSYGALASGAQQALAGDTVLTPAQLAALSGSGQAQIEAARGDAVLLQAVSRQALANASGRFASLQQLIQALGSADDAKATLDLTARIAAEQAMLENEQTKLRTLYAAAEAEHWADEERSRERGIVARGDFATRFRPTP